MTSCNQQGLKPGILNGGRLGYNPVPRALHCSYREDRQTTRRHNLGNSDLKSIWDTQYGGYLLISEHIPERQHSQRDPSGNKGTGRCHFLPPPFYITQCHLWEPAMHPNLLKSIPSAQAFQCNQPSQLCLPQPQHGRPLPPEDQPKPLPMLHLLT